MTVPSVFQRVMLPLESAPAMSEPSGLKSDVVHRFLVDWLDCHRSAVGSPQGDASVGSPGDHRAPIEAESRHVHRTTRLLKPLEFGAMLVHDDEAAVLPADSKSAIHRIRECGRDRSDARRKARHLLTGHRVSSGNCSIVPEADGPRAIAEKMAWL